MAKTLYFMKSSATTHRGTNSVRLTGVSSWWNPLLLSELRNTSAPAVLSQSFTTVAGPTNGIEAATGGIEPAMEWLSEPLSADFTINGTITANLWAAEFSMNDNISVNFLVEKIDGTTGVLTQIVKSVRTVEVAVTTRAANNFTATPTSTVCKRGDRLRVRVFADDATQSMGAGGYMTFSYAATSAGVDGDSYITFTENLTFEPPGDPGVIEVPVRDATATFGLAGGTVERRAQKFIAQGAILTEVKFWAAKVGAPTDDYIVEIQTHNVAEDEPSETVVAIVTTIAGTSLTTTTTQQTISGLSISLTPGATYFLVFRRSGAMNSTNHYNVGICTFSVSGWQGQMPYSGDPVADWTAPTIGPATVQFSFTTSTYYLNYEAVPVAYVEQTAAENATGFGTGTGAAQYAQSFFASGTLTEIQIRLRQIGSPTDNVVIEIQGSSAGAPSGTVIGTVATVPGSSLPTSFPDSNQVYTCSIALATGNTYWLVIRRSGTSDASNYYNIYTTFESVMWGTTKFHNDSVWAMVEAALTCRITPAGIAKSASQIRGTGSRELQTTVTAGPITPIQVTDTIGGQGMEWFTPPLEAIIFGGKVKMNACIRQAVTTQNLSFRGEIAVVDDDGTNAVVWGSANAEAKTTYGSIGEISLNSNQPSVAWISGDDISITAGQRLRFRIFFDDCADVPSAAGGTRFFHINGPTAGGGGDTYVILPVEVTEQIIGPQTFYGAVSMPTTFGKAIAGTRKTFGVIDRPIIFDVTTAGIVTVPAVTHYGATSMAITFDKQVSGSRKTFSQLAFPITFTKNILGQKKTFGQIITPFIFGKAISAQRKTFGQTSLPINFTITTSGIRVGLTQYGVVALPITFGKDIRGQRKTFGQLQSPFIFGKAISAQRKTFGQIVLPISAIISVAGARVGFTQYGVVSFPVMFGKDVRGQRKTFGQIAMPLTFAKQVQGRRKTFGQIVFPIIFTKEAAGSRQAFGQLSMQTLFGKEIAGRRKTFSQLTMPITFSKIVAGRKQTFGKIVLPIGITIVTNGYAFTGPKTYYGNLSLPLIFSKQVSAKRKTFGQVTAPFVFGKAFQGQRRTFSELELPLDFGIAVKSGRVGTYGLVDLKLILTMDINGIVRPIGIILNDAQGIYLGEQEIQAVYVGNEKVWP